MHMQNSLVIFVKAHEMRERCHYRFEPCEWFAVRLRNAQALLNSLAPL